METVVIAHNIRSTHNVGSIFRSCEGFGVTRLILSGYTPYPHLPGDTRLPHIANKLHMQIHKTALGTEEILPFTYAPTPPLDELRKQSYTIVGLEQDDQSVPLHEYQRPDKVALLLGEEVLGIDSALRQQCDVLLEIPMHGTKESFNVSVATGVALYQLTL